MEWPLPNKSYANPQLLSFHGSNAKTGFDSLASAGLVTITTKEIDCDRTSYSTVMQKNIDQGGVRYTVTTYPTNPTKVTVSPASVHPSFLPLSPQPISAIPPLSSSSPVVGTTDLRNSSKISGAPAQLTMFYNGSVCVYDNVSADKAQAIMLLAGNGAPTASSSPARAAPIQAVTPQPSILESYVVNHPYGVASHRPSPAANATNRVSQSLNWGGAISDMNGSKQGSVLVLSNKFEPLRAVSSPASESAFTNSSSSVPQFRRKSLARFLEKRKERAISTAPYDDKESP
ncbi:protein TIFY 6B-like [Salvia splendens]|uniref:protein TIFY 6B-like n=1 Tax=Salvia splendens TaxID=180675 RepID=UPI001C26AA20|nr:protein TIFY 6B-like [Salvia splendens]